MKFIHITLLAVLFSACDSSKVKNASANKVGLDTAAGMYSVENEDRQMNAAIAKARSTSAEFDKAFNSNNPSFTDFSIKKEYSTPDGGGEHMWITDIKMMKGGYAGVINNDAEWTKEVKLGDAVFVAKEELSDWMYIDNNVLKGGYTIRVIRDKLTKEERAKMDEGFAFKIED